MKKLLLLLLLTFLSTQGLTDVGDVYYCEMKSYSSMSLNGQENYELEIFKFKWGEGKLFFDDTTPFNISDEIIIKSKSYSSFTASSYNEVVTLTGRGNFYFSRVVPIAIFSVVAKCDKF